MAKDNSSPIKVLHIASGDLWAGAEVQLFTLARALKNNTTTIVEIVLLNHGQLEQKLLSNGVKVTILDESRLNSITILWKLVQIIRQDQPDLIHTHRIKENILGNVAARLCGNIPTLRTSHGAPEHIPSWKQLPKHIIRWLDLMCGRYLQHTIIAVSADLAKLLETKFPAEKIIVIENGIDLEEMSLYAKDKMLTDPGSTFRVGFVGRLVSVKRVDIFIKTARHLLDNNTEPTFSFHIFGDGPLRDELERLNHRLGTDTIVTFEGHCENIFEEIQNMDALLITSDHEGLPMILLEAMSLGTPIIAHAVGGIPHVLDQGNCGILISENQPCNYALAINQLASNPEKVPILTQLATQRINERYTAIANAQAYYLEYKSLLK